MKKAAFPRMLVWAFLTTITFLFFMTVMRFIFFYQFKPSGATFLEDFNVFRLGFSYDLQIVCAIVLFPFLMGSIRLEYNSKKWLKPASILQVIILIVIIAKLIQLLRKWEMPPLTLIYTLVAVFIIMLSWLFFSNNCNPFENTFARKIFKAYFFIVSILIVLIYSIDFQYYDYLKQRVTSDILNYASDLKVSMNMVWETYPVIKILLLIIVCIAFLYGLTIYWFKRVSIKNYNSSSLTWKIAFLSFAIILIVGSAGKINLYSLKFNDELNWNTAFNFNDNFKGCLALNPVQSFWTSLQAGSTPFDIKKVKEFYPLMVSYLDVQNPDSVNLNYDRTYHAPQATETPNVILVICESFAAYKSSMWGNPLNTTPYFNEMCKNGIFFDRCFSPGIGTARGVWSAITGIPDVDYPNVASSTPASVNQRSIINDYKGYDKFYFIGGRSDFENIGNPFSNNIEGIKIYDGKDFKQKKIDVWGISDKNLFLNANDILKNGSKPFFAVIQTSDNHRPYTIPDEDKKEFKFENYPSDTLKKYGFEGNDELNSFRYSDFCFMKFIEAAKKQNYFKNTIFVFVGDHGNPGVPPNMFPKAWETDWLCYNHVPLLFYAPSLLSPQRIHRTVSQLDVLPSVSALAKISFTNHTLGHNVFDTTQNITTLNNARFLFNSIERAIGVVNDQYVYTFSLTSKKEDFRSSKDDIPLPETPAVEEARKEMKTMTNACFETAKYMLTHNGRRK